MQYDNRLERLLGGSHLANLRKRLRQRYERAAIEGQVGQFRISGLTRDEHATLASLQGRSPRFSGSMQVDVVRIDESLSQAGIAHSLRDALERLDGPILHAATARAHTLALWSTVISSCTHGAFKSLLHMPKGMGLLKRLSKRDPQKASELLHRAEAVLQRLPAHGLTRAQLAADILGDAHALDNGQAIATLVLAAWRKSGLSMLEEGEEKALQEEKVRDIWASAGVLVNELARPALFLNLPTQDCESNRWSLGEPNYLSLRALLRSPPQWEVASRDVFICENPNLLAIAADYLGPSCAPMVCTDGMPAAAQHQLLTQLMQAGALLHYHGDFDWPGLRIGNHVMREYGARSWRFGSDDYLSAVQVAPRSEHRLIGPEAEASWDEALAPAMRLHQLPIPEEAVAATLLDDLNADS